MNDNMQAEHATITKRINGRTRIHTHTPHKEEAGRFEGERRGLFVAPTHTHSRHCRYEPRSTTWDSPYSYVCFSIFPIPYPETLDFTSVIPVYYGMTFGTRTHTWLDFIFLRNAASDNPRHGIYTGHVISITPILIISRGPFHTQLAKK